MHASDAKEAWSRYCEKELALARPIIEKLGFSLDAEQVHISGERFLMSGRKLVLTGTKAGTFEKVIIKVSSEKSGIAEIQHERKTREILHTLNFAQHHFFTPTELAFGETNGMVVSVTAYIEQTLPFVAHALQEQFFLALRALETQEGVHATTYGHTNTIREAFGSTTAEEYKKRFTKYAEEILHACPENEELAKILKDATVFLTNHIVTIKRYEGFLTHTDFVPHNIRVTEHDVCLLDNTSITFGNKYESWARFINYMIVHNPELADMLISYVRDNRDAEEYLALRLLRVYKVTFLMAFYAGTLEKTEGDLNTLNRVRLMFWAEVLQSILTDTPFPHEKAKAYTSTRNTLRSTEEKRRQAEIQQLA